jgi:hypothetical protein
MLGGRIKDEDKIVTQDVNDCLKRKEWQALGIITAVCLFCGWLLVSLTSSRAGSRSFLARAGLSSAPTLWPVFLLRLETLLPPFVYIRPYLRALFLLLQAASCLLTLRAGAACFMPLFVLCFLLCHHLALPTLAKCFRYSLSILGVFYSTVFLGFEVSIIDCIFAASLVFIYLVGRYKPGTVKLAYIFKFM